RNVTGVQTCALAIFPDAVGQRGDRPVDHLERAGAHGDRSREGAAAHLVDPHDDAATGPMAGGESELHFEGREDDRHGASGTSAKLARPSSRRFQLPIGQKITSALPVMSDSSTKPLSPWDSW